MKVLWQVTGKEDLLGQVSFTSKEAFLVQESIKILNGLATHLGHLSAIFRANGHVDLWGGQQATHAQCPKASVI